MERLDTSEGRKGGREGEGEGGKERFGGRVNVWKRGFSQNNLGFSYQMRTQIMTKVMEM
jgi:hypothetical protein